MSRPDIEGIQKRLDKDYQDERFGGSWSGTMYRDLRALLDYVEELESEIAARPVGLESDVRPVNYD